LLLMPPLLQLLLLLLLVRLLLPLLMLLLLLVCSMQQQVGGLGDVVHGLARTCLARGHNVTVIMPFYECLPQVSEPCEV
jgi:hypothetical protein